MPIRDLFVSDVTRDIPPVVYFHEQSPDKLAAEVREYIVTGGFPETHPHHRRVPRGIHEEYVHLLNAIATEVERPGGADLPTVWISGFYGSGKSSFAKLLGLALDGVALPDGSSLSEAWLRRDTSPRAAELRAAWSRLRQHIDPLAVVFDIGGVARDQEQIHAAVVRQVQRRLGYCSTEPLVADYELRLENDGEWTRFEATAREVLGKPWSEVKDKQLAEDDFSLVLSHLFPQRFPDPQSWILSRAGVATRGMSPEEAVRALRDMLQHRRRGATLFLVIDEVSQYVLAHKDRVDRLRAFATELGSALHGKVWLLALGQQKIDEEADSSFLVWAKDRFKIRVHLATTNIRDVVHKRLLQKSQDAEKTLRALFDKHRPELKLFAYGCDDISPEDFIETYPMLPGQIELILQLTTALRSRSARAQGDDQAIRGLLQLLGELFRSQKLADREVGALVTLDQIYEVQHTALDSDGQNSMARILAQCSGENDVLLVRAAKAIALLELIQDIVPTDAKLVAQCLYDRVDRGNQTQTVTDALEELRRRNLLGYSEKLGYKLQSSAGEEWERERRDSGAAGRETLGEIVQETLRLLLAEIPQPAMQGRQFPVGGQFSDGRRVVDAVLRDPRDAAAVRLDFRYLPKDEGGTSTWIKQSDEQALRDRIVWLCGDTNQLDDQARELHRSRVMVNKYKPRRESMAPARKLLLTEEENRLEDLQLRLRQVVSDAWMSGRLYFRGRALNPRDLGASFLAAAQAVTTRILPELFSSFVATQVLPAELLQLIAPDLSGPSPKFLAGDLGILDLDNGRYVPSCGGLVPSRVQQYIEAEGGISGTALLAHFNGPPFGYTVNVVKACVAGLLRGGRLRLQPESGGDVTAVRDAGVRDLFEKDRDFRRATIFPAGDDDIGLQARARICKFFEEHFRRPLDREDNAIADAVQDLFPSCAERLRDVHRRLLQLPDSPTGPAVFSNLGEAIEHCLRSVRKTKPTVKQVKKHLDTLRDGMRELDLYDAELTPDTIAGVRRLHDTRQIHAEQLRELGVDASNVGDAVQRIDAQLQLERPWRDLASLDPDIEAVRACYVAEREKLLQWQESEAERARRRVATRDGFSTLTADQSHRVLRPLAQAQTTTTADAVAPSLSDLRAPFQLRLQAAEDAANDILDGILSEGQKPFVARVDLSLRHRELTSETDVEALVDEIRTRLLAEVRAGRRVRLL